jgi:hypothetical protein
VRISILTPVGPGKDHWLGEAADSVDGARHTATRMGHEVEWVLCLDGTDVSPRLHARPDRVVSLGGNRGLPSARNAALAASTGVWVLPLDSDDVLDIACFGRVVEAVGSADPSVGWIGFNRLLLDGSRTPYWIDEPFAYAVGALAEQWTSPFPFHPNSAALRRDVILGAGGWPATLNEDIAALLAVSEVAAGTTHPAVFTRYRMWEGQITAGAAYHGDMQVAFATIEAIVNARRALLGRTAVTAPDVMRSRDLRSARPNGSG